MLAPVTHQLAGSAAEEGGIAGRPDGATWPPVFLEGAKGLSSACRKPLFLRFHCSPALLAFFAVWACCHRCATPCWQRWATEFFLWA